MKSELDNLIDHFQSEVDYLQSSMEECAAEWDYDGAKAFREPLIFSKRKLQVLKCLRDPNFERISRSKEIINNATKLLSNRKRQSSDFGDKAEQIMNQIIVESIQRSIKEEQNVLEELLSQKPKSAIDDDQILLLLEALEQNEFERIEFEIHEGKISMTLEVLDDDGQLRLIPLNDSQFSEYGSTKYHSLRELGFDMSNGSKLYPDFKRQDKLEILRDISVIYFEIFGIYQKRIEIKVS